MPTQTTTPPDVQQMFVVHRAFRREFTALPGYVGRVADGDVDRAHVVADHVDLVLGGLHLHHTGEDEILWPLLAERAAPSTGLVETMLAQHDGVDALADQVHRVASTWRERPTTADGRALASLLERLAVALFEHLDLEEREVVPLLARYVTAEEWERAGQHGRDVMTPAQLPLLFGALLEEASRDEAAAMLAPLPRPVRLVLRTIGARRYRRYVTRLRTG